VSIFSAAKLKRPSRQSDEKISPKADSAADSAAGTAGSQHRWPAGVSRIDDAAPACVEGSANGLLPETIELPTIDRIDSRRATLSQAVLRTAGAARLIKVKVRNPEPDIDSVIKADVASIATKENSGTRCLAVMYHYVRDKATAATEGIVPLSPRAFAEQLDALCTVAEPIDWPALRAWTQGEGNLPACCFLLTFDDGLADHAEIVAPILDARGLRGTFFVAGEVLTRPRMLSAHAIHLLVAHLGYDRFARELHEMLHTLDPQRDWTEDLDDAEALSIYHYEPPDRARLKYLLNMVLPAELRNVTIDALFERFVGSTAEWARRWYLQWDQLRAMQAAGHTIGGHGYSHEPLGRMSVGDQRRDIQSVAAVLNEVLGCEVRPLSLPFGSNNQATAGCCREAGFAHAFTTERNWIDGAANLTLLPRIDTIHVRQEIEKAGLLCSSK